MPIYVKRREKVQGPFTNEQILKFVKTKKISSKDLVSTASEGPFEQLGSVWPSILDQGNSTRDTAPSIDTNTRGSKTDESSEEARVFLRQGDAVNGPVTLRSITRTVNEGGLKKTDLIRSGEKGPWYEIGEVWQDIQSGEWNSNDSVASKPKEVKHEATIADASDKAVEELSPKQRKEIEKIVFAQDKYRNSFPLALSQFFKPGEFILADTYGINEYYVLTTERLLICEITISGVFTTKQTLGGPKKTVKLDSIVRLTDWSDLWWENGDLDNPAMMNLQIETLQGDHDLCVVYDSDKGYYHNDPLHFSGHLHEAYLRTEEEQTLREAEIYTKAKIQ